MSKLSDCFEFLDGWADGVGELPDGAWLEAMHEGVRQFCKKRKCRFEPLTTVALWFESRSQEVKTEPAPASV